MNLKSQTIPTASQMIFRLIFEVPTGGEANGVKVKEISVAGVVVEVGAGRELKTLR